MDVRPQEAKDLVTVELSSNLNRLLTALASHFDIGEISGRFNSAIRESIHYHLVRKSDGLRLSCPTATLQQCESILDDTIQHQIADGAQTGISRDDYQIIKYGVLTVFTNTQPDAQVPVECLATVIYNDNVLSSAVPANITVPTVNGSMPPSEKLAFVLSLIGSMTYDEIQILINAVSEHHDSDVSH